MRRYTQQQSARTCVDEEGLGEVRKTDGEANTIGCLWWLLLLLLVLLVMGVAARAFVVRRILATHHLPTRSRRT